MKVIIAGSRNFSNFLLLSKVCDNALIKQREIEIVSGTANGADKLGERYANIHNYKIKKFPANWDKYGKSAGYRRNEEMANYADALIAFWDGKSVGTKHMIEMAKKYNLKLKVEIFGMDAVQQHIDRLLGFLGIKNNQMK